jgi:exonuclease VII small subunit
MSDTPRTELMVERAPIGLRTNVAFEQSCDLCRQLERELNEANKTISLQHELMTTAEKRGVDKAKEELNEAKDRIKRLEEAGDKMDPMNDTECECDDRSVLICKYCFDSSTRWFKAKEAKP